jgi:serine/threonine protein kinase
MNARAATIDADGLAAGIQDAGDRAGAALLADSQQEASGDADRLTDSGPTMVAPTAHADSPAQRPGAMKFLYAHGARPLDGYTIKRGIGRGGFGEVYFATSDAGKEVALKHVERNLEVELRGVSQCLNLKHVNLIDLYDVRYDEQGDAWVVMEYVAGQSLKDVIDRNPNGLPLDEVGRWFAGLAAGTAYLHDHGIVHRDLKPGNIFEDEGVVKIGDYGLSKFISTSRRSGQTESVGTFHYMAPEIGKGIYGKEIDIYALGIILYEMITGRVPFEGESSQEIIMKHLTADPDLSGIPQPFRAIIQRAMQKDPAKRFASVGEMLAALDSANKLAGSKPAPGAPQILPSAFAIPTAVAVPEPVYIGDDDEEIRLGPLQEKPLQEKPLAAAAKVNGKKAPVLRPLRQPDEPIARACRHGWERLAHWWNHGPMTTPLKIGLLIVVAIVAIFNGPWIMAGALVLGSLYLVYLGIRILTQALRGPGPAPVPAALDIRQAAWHPQAWEQQGRAMLGMKTPGDRVGELTGSMLAAAAIALVLTVVMSAIGGEALDNSPSPLAGPAWLWLMTTFGSWLVLGAGKFCERSSGEPVRRRFGMLVLGLAFGALAFVSSEFLMVRFTDGIAERSPFSDEFARHMFSTSGAPRIAAFLTYFGLAFLLIGWWKQTDPLRSSRLRIGPILVAFFVAFVGWGLLGFPQPWGFMLLAAISITAQLSAPWLSPQDRTAMLGKQSTART